MERPLESGLSLSLVRRMDLGARSVRHRKASVS